MRNRRIYRLCAFHPIVSVIVIVLAQFIAYSLLDGSVKIIRTENGERVINVDNLGCQSVEVLNFVPFAQVNPEEFMPFIKNSMESKLILNISPHKNCNK